MNSPVYDPPKTARDWQGKEVPIKRPKGKILAFDIRGPVELIRTGKDSFAVVYGLQVEKGLSRFQAASEYGKCLTHMLQCEGLLD